MKPGIICMVILCWGLFAQYPIFAQSARYKAHLNVARQHGVPLLKSSAQVKNYVGKKKLAKVNSGKGYRVQKLDYSSPYLTPRAKAVLNQIARSFNAQTKSTFTVTSLTRTVHSQSRLRRVNGNATSGLSSHNYGSSFDISYIRFNGRKGPNKRLERALHAVLANYQARGKILFIKEYYVSCFHVTVR
ncbi:DUF5715 family protein [Niabella sp. CC-SYL272]|uniref:DUF5715 family protein n=1 Tax=Niabella agricola TaxID=2891571 RepID=UPI001F3936C2|nr:DUF5715 family protein [Niabella agricola]MCF3107509.1 DUF5715 family protein [Niabella agricola]